MNRWIDNENNVAPRRYNYMKTVKYATLLSLGSSTKACQTIYILKAYVSNSDW